MCSSDLIGLLERRLDALVYRAKFVPTVFAARQFVSHGHVTVNGKRVTIPSYSLRKGDVVGLGAKARAMIVVQHNIDTIDRQVPMWLEVSAGDHTATVRDLPLREQIDVPVREQLIVELYSK